MSARNEILVVEDSPTQAEKLRYLLEERGYEVAVAGNGREGLIAAGERRPALVVSDIVMPEMDGPTLLKAMREKNPDIKFIFVSGYAEDAFEKSLPEGQQFDFLPKPFTLSQLVAAVKETMTKQG